VKLPDLAEDVASFAGRALMASLFLVEGAKKIADYAGAAEYMRDYGVNGHLLPLVIATEIGGASLILLGLLTPWASLCLAGFALLTALLFHWDLADANQAIQFEKNLAIAGGLVLLAAVGPGRWSLDGWLRHRHTSNEPK
jgi:putative oxidoreductase